jgi:Zn-finger nucleic acid-binding protein
MEGSEKPKITAFNCPNCGAAVDPDSPSCTYCGSALAVGVCPSCYGAVSIGMKHCPHCGSEVVNTRPEKVPSLQCPCCEKKLAAISVGNHTLNVCEHCGGIWVDKNSFQDICTHEEEQEAVLGFAPRMQENPSTQKRKPRRAYIPCPQCGKLMNHKNFSHCSGVVLDWCRGHGSWFDREELRRIVTFIRNGGLRLAREKERAELQEREARLRMQEFELAARGNRFDSEFRGHELELSSDPLLEFISRMFR